ncbi:MAG: hypothetical protein JSW21_08285 [Gammaproteobacteria bacterium]|jgi:hypothetical protein|nr:MAG: hypothetical protein JSW21_08285 [Gammaproteobacteria bacterium]
MLRNLILCIPLFLGSGSILGEEEASDGDKLISGMSIVGNHEAPKSLVIVPWKSSELGNGLDVSRVLDDGRGPVDKDVFMRELDYYEIRVE